MMRVTEPPKGGLHYGYCRCCLSQGHHLVMTAEHYWEGVREVYVDIIEECFAISLQSPMDPPHELSLLICSACVQRVRDASHFKIMITSSGQHLKQMFEGHNDDLIQVVNQADDIKIENEIDLLKEENDDTIKDEIVDHDLEFEFDGTNNSDTAEDDVDEKFESLLKSFVRRDAKPLPKKSILPRRPPASFMKHCRLKKGTQENYTPQNMSLHLECEKIPQQMTSRLNNEEFAQIEAKSQNPDVGITHTDIKTLIHTMKNIAEDNDIEAEPISEKSTHIANMTIILKNSNATPFKGKKSQGFLCFYCRLNIKDLPSLRQHIIDKHNNCNMKNLLWKYGAESLSLYVDVTDLKCTKCDLNVGSLTILKSHLQNTHKIKLYDNVTDRIVPFKISAENKNECQICGFNFETFGSIERHMNTHFRNYTCKECGSGFVTKYRLKTHIKNSHTESKFPCTQCKKVFCTQSKLKCHVDAVHRLTKRFKCPHCSERFNEYFKRHRHLVEQHDEPPLTYKCNVCDRNFDRRYNLSKHLKKDHLEERNFLCDLCMYKCFTKHELQAHMVKHTGQRIHECLVCKKSYARKKTLTEHMRIHNDDKRFSCNVCGLAFVQKCSLKGHMKSQHPEYADMQ